MAKAKKETGSIRVTLIKSTIGSLGLRRMHHTVEVEDTPAVRGMINAVGYLLKVEA